jgi:hypothetical protein
VTQLLAVVMAVLLPLWGLLSPPQSLAAMDPAPEQFQCEGEPLLAAVHIGAVDAPGIPNTASGTVPGAFIVLQWRGVSLQLPRTNNAGTPSYSDGRWWWQASDPAHPEFAQRRGDWEFYSCEASP